MPRIAWLMTSWSPVSATETPYLADTFFIILCRIRRLSFSESLANVNVISNPSKIMSHTYPLFPKFSHIISWCQMFVLKYFIHYCDRNIQYIYYIYKCIYTELYL